MMRRATLLLQFWTDQTFFSLAAVAAALTILYFVVRAIYRITIHPLCAYPGPKLRAISHLPQAIAGASGRQFFAIRDLHAQYGEVFEVRPDAQPVLTAAGEDHVRQRGALAHGFSERAINGQEASVTRHINLFIEKLEENAKDNKNVDMNQWMRFLAFDIIGDFTLSMQFGCVANSGNHPWVTLLVKWFRAVSFADNVPAFGILAPFLMLFADRKALMGIKTHLDISATKLRERLEIGDDPEKNDLWTYVMRNKGDKALTLGEMEVNAGFILSAATEPVSDTLCGAVYLLAKHRGVLEKLQKEIESSVKSDKEITMSAFANMPYLHAVLDEFDNMILIELSCKLLYRIFYMRTSLWCTDQ
ncbi:cytochrome P450 [Lepidopterella palustris CBS 459.81]|uniref:Cytochrome P450 n=1 Tax=Lepidopterella palustris CBS 459.81 TaxID=1314670 RepID=A0A8E2DX52_9PEZI|nr:cytochrome P450 [Lepidopterella palustris CBS 459.81]